MKRLGLVLVLGVGLGGGLGACSTAMEVTSALGDSDMMRLNQDITPENERLDLIKAMTQIKASHHSDALEEIKAR